MEQENENLKRAFFALLGKKDERGEYLTHPVIYTNRLKLQLKDGEKILSDSVCFLPESQFKEIEEDYYGTMFLSRPTEIRAYMKNIKSPV